MKQTKQNSKGSSHNSNRKKKKFNQHSTTAHSQGISISHTRRSHYKLCNCPARRLLTSTPQLHPWATRFISTNRKHAGKCETRKRSFSPSTAIHVRWPSTGLGWALEFSSGIDCFLCFTFGRPKCVFALIITQITFYFAFGMSAREAN